MSVQSKGIKISELFSCSTQDQDMEIEHLFQAALNPTDIQIAEQSKAINVRIKKFERRYEMSSVSMREKLHTGAIKETADICSWLMLLKAREDFELESPKSRTDKIQDICKNSQ